VNRSGVRRKLAVIYLRLGSGIVLLALLLVFAVQNAEPARVRFLSWNAELSQSLLLFFALLVGILIGLLMSGWLRWRRKGSGNREP
jgi:uncharacterized integral membrane protein